jgi:hypothetical protein
VQGGGSRLQAEAQTQTSRGHKPQELLFPWEEGGEMVPVSGTSELWQVCAFKAQS